MGLRVARVLCQVNDLDGTVLLDSLVLSVI